MKKKNLLQRTIIIALVTLVGIYIVIGPRRTPTLHDFTWSGIKATLASNIRLGLDLKGGSHLVMRVKTDEFLKKLDGGQCAAPIRDGGKRRRTSAQGCEGRRRLPATIESFSKLRIRPSLARSKKR